MFTLLAIVAVLAVLGWFVFPTQAKALLAKAAGVFALLGKLWPTKPAVNVAPTPTPVANTTATTDTTTTPPSA